MYDMKWIFEDELNSKKTRMINEFAYAVYSETSSGEDHSFVKKYPQTISFFLSWMIVAELEKWSLLKYYLDYVYWPWSLEYH